MTEVPPDDPPRRYVRVPGSDEPIEIRPDGQPEALKDAVRGGPRKPRKKWGGKARLASQRKRERRDAVYNKKTHPERAHKLALLGLTDEQIGVAFGVIERTIYAWKKLHPEFAEAIESGKLAADAKVAQSLYNRGVGFEKDAVKIFYDAKKGEPVYAPYKEYYPGEVSAAVWWLKNRQPQQWRDKHEIEHTGSVQHEIRAMTPEQRLVELRKLQEKVERLMLEAPAEQPMVIDVEAVEVEPEDL